MDPMRMSGLGSGLDTESMISKLMAVEQRPLTKADQEIAKMTRQTTAWSDIKSVLSGLKTAADNLALSNTWKATTVSSSDPAVTASVSGNPVASAYQMTVTTLASGETVQSATQSSDSSALSLSGTFTIGGKSVTVISSDSLNGVRDKINSAGADVTASVLKVGTNQYTLLVQSTKTGTANAVAYVDDTTGTPLKKLGLLTSAGAKNMVAAAKDAQFTVGSISFTRSTNTVSDVIPSVSLTLKSTQTTAFSITVGTDTAGLSGKINDFVSRFNSVIDKIKSYTGKNAALEGDGALLALQSRLVQQAMNVVKGLPSTLQTLGQVGVTIDRDGHLTVDSSKLTSQLGSNPTGVASLFTTSTYGLAPTFSRLLDGYTRASGTLDRLNKTFEGRVKQVQAHKDSIKQLLKVREASLRQQFSAMEKAVSTLRSQGNWLANQLGMASTGR